MAQAKQNTNSSCPQVSPRIGLETSPVEDVSGDIECSTKSCCLLDPKEEVLCLGYGAEKTHKGRNEAKGFLGLVGTSGQVQLENGRESRVLSDS